MSLNQYTVIQVLGSGTSGVANLVRCEGDGKEYVQKLVSMAKFKQKDLINAMGEVQVLSSIHHPYIVRHKESYVDGDTLVIIMEYADGGDLNAVVNDARAANEPIEEEVILDYFTQLCLAMKYLHERRILHRDLKLQNVFLMKNGTVKLGDFGLTVALEDSFTNAVTCLGTPYYMSPELCESKPYNAKTDMWALGCILFKLCTFQHAFLAQNFRELTEAILNTPTPKLSSVTRYKYSSKMNKLVNALLEKRPENRPSIEQVLDYSLIKNRISKFRTPELIAAEATPIAPAANQPGGEDWDQSFSGSISHARKAETEGSDSDEDGPLRAAPAEENSERAYDVLKERLAAMEVSSKDKPKTTTRRRDVGDDAATPTAAAKKPAATTGSGAAAKPAPQLAPPAAPEGHKRKTSGGGGDSHNAGLQELRELYLKKKTAK